MERVLCLIILATVYVYKVLCQVFADNEKAACYAHTKNIHVFYCIPVIFVCYSICSTSLAMQKMNNIYVQDCLLKKYYSLKNEPLQTFMHTI